MQKYYKQKAAEAQSRLAKQKGEHIIKQQKKMKKLPETDIEGEIDSDLIDEDYLDIDQDLEQPDSLGLGEKLLKEKDI